MKRPVILPFGEESLAAVRFSAEPIKMARGGCIVPAFDRATGNKVAFQTAKVRVPFGLSTFQADGGGAAKQSLSVSCGEEFEAVLRAFDETVIRTVVENYPAWFGKTTTEADVRAIFFSSVRDSSDPTRYSATWKVPIPNYGGTCQVDVFDEKRDLVSLDAVQKGTYVVVLAELSGLWFVDRKFGIKWKPLQMIVSQSPPPQQQPQSQQPPQQSAEPQYMFIDE